ncbi:MAG: D-2-hydroxyacid dehydrogenase [Caulobacteraceae bacterium]|nr:D-2-hydroxyacid dehydrogenase [Caulobacteraceae bacterium]
MYEPSFRRLAADLSGFAGVRWLLMRPDGSISLDGAFVAAEDARPEIGWINADLFGDAPIRGYMTVLLKSPDLKWVQSGAAGFDDAAFGRIVAKGARLTTNHSQAVGMSEYVLAGVLDHFQRGPERRAAQGRRAWARLPFREVAGSSWLVIGFGAIGRAVAVKARAFGAQVTGVRRSDGPDPDADAMAAPGEVQRLLGGADVVVLSLPLSRETAGMVDARFLAAMKPGSVLVNVGRGGLVDEDALLAALDAGKPEHAVLDVFRAEPLPADSRFWNHPRVALTGHASAMGSGLTARGDALFLENLRHYLAGEPLRNEASAAEVMGG